MGIGPMLGLAIGGWLFDTVGSHLAYAAFAVVILSVGVAYAALDGSRGDLRGVPLPQTPVSPNIGKPRLFSEGDCIIDDHDQQNDHAAIKAACPLESGDCRT